MKSGMVLVAGLLMLGGCASLGGGANASSEPPSVTIKALADAGCKIQFSVGFGGATGQLGGGVHADNSFSGSCDPTIMQQLGTNITGGPVPLAKP